jgi:hypothetical protein
MLPAQTDNIDLVYVGCSVEYASTLLAYLLVVISYSLLRNYSLDSFLL